MSLHLLRCPSCLACLDEERAGLKCRECGAHYDVRDGVADFFVGEETGSEVVEANIRYYDSTAQDYEAHVAAKEIFNRHAQSRINEILGDIARDTAADLLVDLGCGTGNVLRSARSRFKTTLGFDASAQMLAESRKQGFEVHRASIHRLPLGNETADAVTAYSVLHHLRDPTRLFEEAHRILKRGGRLYTDNDPNALSKKSVRNSRLFRLLRNIYTFVFTSKEKTLQSVDVSDRELAEYHHFHKPGLDSEAMERSLRDLGFRQVSVHLHGNAPGLGENRFGKCPWEYQAMMLVQAAIVPKWNYARFAPVFLIVAEK